MCRYFSCSPSGPSNSLSASVAQSDGASVRNRARFCDHSLGCLTRRCRTACEASEDTPGPRAHSDARLQDRTRLARLSFAAHEFFIPPTSFRRTGKLARVRADDAMRFTRAAGSNATTDGRLKAGRLRALATLLTAVQVSPILQPL